MTTWRLKETVNSKFFQVPLRLAMDKTIVGIGALLLVAGLTGIVYGAGVNVPGMVARKATDYSFITAYITEWFLIMVAGLLLIAKGLRSK